MGNHNIMTTGMSEQISKRIGGSPQQRISNGKRLFSELNNQRVIQNTARRVDVSFR